MVWPASPSSAVLIGYLHGEWITNGAVSFLDESESVLLSVRCVGAICRRFRYEADDISAYVDIVFEPCAFIIASKIAASSFLISTEAMRYGIRL